MERLKLVDILISSMEAAIIHPMAMAPVVPWAKTLFAVISPATDSSDIQGGDRPPHLRESRRTHLDCRVGEKGFDTPEALCILPILTQRRRKLESRAGRER